MKAKELLRAEELKKLIKHYDYLYYEKGITEISDAEYDRLYDEYLQLEVKYPELKEMEDAPSKRVGAGNEAGTTTGLPKFTHKSPLLSIDRKAKELSELKDFYEKCGGDGVSVIVEPKLDGITCNINYENGKFVNAATRGNGYIGDLITENFKNTDSVYPKNIDDNASIELRGEAIIPYNFFKENLIEDYSNPRNAVAGIMRQITPEDVKGKGIQVMFYDFGQVEKLILSDDDSENVQKIKTMGFGSIPISLAKTWDELKTIVESHFEGMIQNIDGFNVLTKEGYPMAVCDGLVIKVASFKLRTEIGMSEKGPKWAFAYKFKPLQAETRIDHVEWQVGKSGRATPVAVFDEVSLGGTKITKATLNNYDYMQNLPILESQDNGKGLMMDDVIIVERSNDVIPRVVAIKHRSEHVKANDMTEQLRNFIRDETFKEPKKCPVCGTDLTREGPLHFCTSPTCPAQIKGKIEHYASRNAMNIVGLGEGIIEVLFEKEFLTDLPSVYKLHEYKDELIKLNKFGKRKVEKLLQSIEDSKNPELWQFIYALSINNVGRRASKDLAQRYHTLENFLCATKEELLSMESIGEIMANTILNFINSDMKNIINELLKLGVTPKEVELTGEKFKGMTFVITGTLKESRSYYQEIIEKNGGKVSGSVSKKTTAVLVGSDAGSKETKARKFVTEGAPIKILDTEEMIMNFLNN